MTERIACCVRGCRRTFKHDGDEGEVMCGKHWRAVDIRFRRLHGSAKRVLKKLLRRFPNPREISEERARVVWAAIRREERRWRTVRLEAQRLQDMGYFAPKPRGKRSLSASSDEVAKSDQRRADRFEDQFQRLKRAQHQARHP